MQWLIRPGDRLDPKHPPRIHECMKDIAGHQGICVCACGSIMPPSMRVIEPCRATLDRCKPGEHEHVCTRSTPHDDSEIPHRCACGELWDRFGATPPVSPLPPVIRVYWSDGTDREFHLTPGDGWRVDIDNNALVLGKFPRLIIPLAGVRFYEVRPADPQKISGPDPEERF